MTQRMPKMTPEDRTILETPYASARITTADLVQQYGSAIRSQGGIRGEDEQAELLRNGLALRLPGQSNYSQQ